VKGTGAAADFLLPMVLEQNALHQIKATRIDLQCTVPLVVGTKFNGQWLWTVTHSTSTIIGTGTAVTLYPTGFGSTSDVSWRIYVKEGKGNALFLRFEVMIRGKKSKEAFKAMAAGVPAKNLYHALFDQLLHRFYYLSHLDESMAVAAVLDGEGVKVLVPLEERNTFAWLRNITIPSLEKFLNSHDNPMSEKEELLRAIEYTARHQRINGAMADSYRVRMVDGIPKLI